MNKLEPLIMNKLKNIYPFTNLKPNKVYYCENNFIVNSTNRQLETDVQVS